jgi:site-specific DNA-methyltransferase (adenine-specific)
VISTKHESWEGVLYKKDNVDSIICGNTLDVLRTMPDESIDCCITSPPYWGLRDYGIDSQLGLEPTFQLYIEHLLEIFDQVHRVLKKTGTCWVNLGDTYAGSWGHSGHRPERTGIVGHHYVREGHPKFNPPSSRVQSVQAKALCNIPFHFAIGMTDHKWIERNCIIWHKPSCMPSSAKDRFTVDFEYVFFFVKSKKYWFEQQFEANVDSYEKAKVKHGATKKYIGTPLERNCCEGDRYNPNGRNRRAVWRINPQPFKDAHFAVFPEKLVEPMILAGCPLEGTVLDPFAGSGTTCLVARKLGRHYIGIDLNPNYCDMANKRLAEVL